MPEGAANYQGAAYRLDGPEAAPVLVLLGSLGTTAGVWDLQVPVLRPWFRLLRVEHPGHGGSSVPPGEGSLDALGARVVGLLDHLGIEQAHLCGLSLGGLVGLWVAVNHPSRVGKLVVSCVAGRFNDPETYRQRAASVRRDGSGSVVPAVLTRWFTEPFSRSHPEVQARFGAMVSAVAPGGYAYCAEVVAGADLRARLGDIVAPTLVVGGALDPVVPPELAVATSSAIPGALLCVLPGAAHLANVEKAAPYNEILLSHLLGSPGERGLLVRKAVLGEEHVERALAASTPLSRDFQTLLNRWAWGDIPGPPRPRPPDAAPPHDRPPRRPQPA